MSGFDTWQTAGGMEQLIEDMIEKRLNDLRPKPKYAKVYSIDRATRSCLVVFNGDVAPVKVVYGAIAPAAVNQIVRVEGVANDRYIADVLGPTFTDSNVTTAQSTADAANTRASTVLGSFDPGGYVGGWANFNAGWPALGYMKTGNQVSLRGLIKNVGGPITANQFYGTYNLPAAFRPLQDENFIGGTAGGGCRIDILIGGLINVSPMVNVAQNSYITVSGITYYVP